MYEKQIDFSAIKDLTSYLVVSGLNRWRKRYATEQKKLAEERNVLHYFYEYMEDNYPPGLEDQSDLEIRFKAVEQSLSKVNEKCRSVLTRFYLEGQTMEEIAETMDFKSSGVATTIKYQCLKGLKHLVEEVIKKLH